MENGNFSNYPIKYYVLSLYGDDSLSIKLAIIVKCYVKQHVIKYNYDGLAGESYVIGFPDYVVDELHKYNFNINDDKICMRGDIYETYEEANVRKNKIINNIIVDEVRKEFNPDEYKKLGIEYLENFKKLEQEKIKEIEKYTELENIILETMSDYKIDNVRARRLIP